MIRSLVVVFSLYLTCSTHSVGCMDDFDLDDKDRQGYNYPIPHSNEPGYWREVMSHRKKDPETGKVLDKGVEKLLMFWSRSFYIFGKFLDESAGEDTTISAGLYRGKKLIYKTVINCDSGTWENWVLNKRTRRKEVLLRGDIQKNLTSCKAGENFDLILKNDNRRLANWILNSQPLQHDVEYYQRNTYKVMMNGLGDTSKFQDIYTGSQQRKGISRPAVKVDSKYSTFAATRFEFTATGRAVFSRLAFGQCNAWPKNMDMQCQNVRNWIQHRSKAKLTTMTMIDNMNTRDENFTRGLGTFGNNMQSFLPDCLTDKYFNFFQTQIHSNKYLPLRENASLYMYTDKNGKEFYREIERNNKQRSLCCCTNMTTGRVLDDDEKKYCVSLPECITDGWTCRQAFDPEIGREIDEQFQKEKQEKEEAYEQGLKNGNGIFAEVDAGVKPKYYRPVQIKKNERRLSNGVYF